VKLVNNSAEGVRDAIEKGQAIAMGFNPAKSLAEDYSVEVKITKKSLPNVTLIDLPGFTNATDEATRIVIEMVKK